VNGDGGNARPGQRLREPRGFLHGAVEGEDLGEPVLFDRFAQRLTSALTVTVSPDHKGGTRTSKSQMISSGT
jgi:hypothetical protein